MSGMMAMMAGNARTAIASAVATLVYDLDAANFSGFPATGGSITFNGSTQSIQIPTNSAFTYGTQDFTIEWWGYQTSTSGVQGIWRNSTGDAANSVGFWTITQSGGTLTVSIGNGTTTDTVVSNSAITINTWNHYAFVRNGTLFKLYINGVAQTSTLTSSINLPAQAAFMQIGNAGGLYAGRITNFRIVKGTAVYTADFTPSTRPLKNINITDYTAKFNGSSQYFDIASTSAFGFGTADFTIECWWRPTADQRSDVLDFWSTPGTNPVTRFDIGRITSTTLDLYTDGTGGSGAKITGPTIASLLNKWNHIAVTRESGSIKMWVNGVQAGSTYSANVLDMGTAGMDLRIMGDHGASGNGSGNLSNVRVVKGTALYTTAFAPPGNALTAISGTQLLLPLTSTPFTDTSTNAITVTNTGSVTLSTDYPLSATSLLLLVWGNTPYVDSSPYAHTLSPQNTPAYNASSPFTSVNDATGTYSITVNNAGSIAYNIANSGSWVKSSSVGTDWFLGGPNYVTGQSYTVFVAYKLSATSSGRLLNTSSEAVKDWTMGAYNGNPNSFYPNFTVNLPSSGADTVWHLDWATWDNSTNTGTLYTATTTAPTSAAFTATNASGGGFNQIRIFNRAGASETQTGNVAFVKVYDGVLDLATIQSLHATYKARFGY